MTDQDTNNTNKTDAGERSSSSNRANDLLEADPPQSKKRNIFNWHKKTKSKIDATNPAPGFENKISNTLNTKLVSSDKRPKLNRKIIFLVASLVAVIVVAGGWFLVNQSRNKQSKPEDKVLFIIDGREYRQSEVNQIIGSAVTKGIKINEANKRTFEYLKSQTAAKKAGVEPSEDQIKEAVDVLFSGKSNPSKDTNWGKMIAYDYALKKSLGQNLTQTTQGYSYVFWFGDNIQYDYPQYDSSMTIPRSSDAGNQDLMKQDKEYAQSQADKYHEALRKGTKNPEQVLKQIKADSRLSYSRNPGANMSVKFGAQDGKNWEVEVYYNDIVDFISKKAKAGLSEIQMGQVPLTDDSSPTAKKADAFYYFVDLKKNDDAKASFELALKNLKAEYYGS